MHVLDLRYFFIETKYEFYQQINFVFFLLASIWFHFCYQFQVKSIFKESIGLLSQQAYAWHLSCVSSFLSWDSLRFALWVRFKMVASENEISHLIKCGMRNMGFIDWEHLHIIGNVVIKFKKTMCVMSYILIRFVLYQFSFNTDKNGFSDIKS